MISLHRYFFSLSLVFNPLHIFFFSLSITFSSWAFRSTFSTSAIIVTPTSSTSDSSFPMTSTRLPIEYVEHYEFPKHIGAPHMICIFSVFRYSLHSIIRVTVSLSLLLTLLPLSPPPFPFLPFHSLCCVSWVNGSSTSRCHADSLKDRPCPALVLAAVVAVAVAAVAVAVAVAVL